jgi:hypothetical protein
LKAAKLKFQKPRELQAAKPFNRKDRLIASECSKKN